ncbi:MAG TPA: SRPBCC domain-containing protein [Gaiellaceae bacterium]|nr:SRPBCC domain-containing protein [Gaiellaceae bacterium]
MELTREIELDASREEVWAALTEAERLEEWFANDVELDARPGGEAVFRWENGEERRGVVEEFEEERRLALRWDDDGVVEIELDDTVNGTVLVVRETTPEFGPALEVQALRSSDGPTARWLGAMDECDARTQGVGIAELFPRPRTQQRAVQCVPTARASAR